jgi:hypothetical protein
MADLTTLAKVKSFMTITTTGPDAVLSSLITACSDDFVRAIERTDFIGATYTEVRQGDGGNRMPLHHWPIASVASVTVAGVTVSPSANQIADGWYINADLDPERRNQLWTAGAAVFTDNAPVVVTYDAGYLAVGGNLGLTLPTDVEQAVIDWVADRYQSRPGTGVQSQRLAGGEHVEYDKDSPMPDSVARVVCKYKRSWPSQDRRNDDRDYRVTRITKVQTRTEKVDA